MKTKIPFSTKAPKAASRRPVTHEDVSRCAHDLWIKKGCPEGQSDQIWYEAERIVATGLKPDGKDDPGFADPEAPINDDGNPSGSLEERLRELTGRAGDRSATSI